MFSRGTLLAVLIFLMTCMPAIAQDAVVAKKNITLYELTAISGRDHHAEGCVSPTGGFLQLPDGRITLVEIKTSADTLLWIEAAEVDRNKKTTCLKESVMAFVLQLDGKWYFTAGAILHPTKGKIAYSSGRVLVQLANKDWVDQLDLIASK